jgi:hypothetical protein
VYRKGGKILKKLKKKKGGEGYGGAGEAERLGSHLRTEIKEVSMEYAA